MELSVTETFFAYCAMVKILATLKSPCAKACYLTQKLELVVERVDMPESFENKYFL